MTARRLQALERHRGTRPSSRFVGAHPSEHEPDAEDPRRLLGLPSERHADGPRACRPVRASCRAAISFAINVQIDGTTGGGCTPRWRRHHVPDEASPTHVTVVQLSARHVAARSKMRWRAHKAFKLERPRSSFEWNTVVEEVADTAARVFVYLRIVLRDVNTGEYGRRCRSRAPSFVAIGSIPPIPACSRGRSSSIYAGLSSCRDIGMCNVNERCRGPSSRTATWRSSSSSSRWRPTARTPRSTRSIRGGWWPGRTSATTCRSGSGATTSSRRRTRCGCSRS